jgi:hypothetical protein
MSKAKARMEWARDMRAREVVIAWLQRMGKAAPEKKLPHIEFGIRLQAILEPERIEARFAKTGKAAAAYVRGVAQMIGGRDCLAPPRMPPVEVQRRAHEKKIERQQQMFDRRREAEQHRVEAKIAKVDREIAERMAARRVESALHHRKPDL